MEGGVGSRLGRSSSRYGSTTTTAAVFNGPVRRWKRQWVTTSEPDYNTDNNRGQRLHDATPLRLCRWIPLPSAPSDTTAAAAADDSHSAPKRKVPRYAPVTMLEALKKEARNKVKKSKANLKERTGATFEKSHYTDDADDVDDDDDVAASVQDNEELMMEQEHVNHHHQRFQNSQLYVNKF